MTTRSPVFQKHQLSPYPSVDITLNQGQQIHLVAGIHVGTAAMVPLPNFLINKLMQTDILFVEADVLNEKYFNNFLQSNNPISILKKLTKKQKQLFTQSIDKIDISIEQIEYLLPWQSALFLQAKLAEKLGMSAKYGIDFQVLTIAHRKLIPIIELEGINTQIKLLQQLPDKGLDLLIDTLCYWDNNASLLQELTKTWLSLSKTEFKKKFKTLFVLNPFLQKDLLENRNKKWAQILLRLPQGRYIVVAGAAHIYGPNNLIELLRCYSSEIRGY